MMNYLVTKFASGKVSVTNLGIIFFIESQIVFFIYQDVLSLFFAKIIHPRFPTQITILNYQEKRRNTKDDVAP